MTDINTLIRRIDQELAADVKDQKAAWESIAAASRERWVRLQRYEAVAQHLIELLKPRLAAFIERFKALVKAEPSIC
jgi:hypothetical protein